MDAPKSKDTHLFLHGNELDNAAPPKFPASPEPHNQIGTLFEQLNKARTPRPKCRPKRKRLVDRLTEEVQADPEAGLPLVDALRLPIASLVGELLPNA
jgi:hypothetical protein